MDEVGAVGDDGDMGEEGDEGEIGVSGVIGAIAGDMGEEGDIGVSGDGRLPSPTENFLEALVNTWPTRRATLGGTVWACKKNIVWQCRGSGLVICSVNGDEEGDVGEERERPVRSFSAPDSAGRYLLENKESDGDSGRGYTAGDEGRGVAGPGACGSSWASQTMTKAK